MAEVSLWIRPGLFFCYKKVYGSGYGDWLIIAARTIPIASDRAESFDEAVPPDVLCARFRRVEPGSSLYCLDLEEGPPRGWRWIVYDGQLIAEKL